MHDIEMNLHDDLKNNHGQLKQIKICIYILITHKEISKIITHFQSTSHKSIIQFKTVHFIGRQFQTRITGPSSAHSQGTNSKPG
jgi:hypothetical protein